VTGGVDPIVVCVRGSLFGVRRNGASSGWTSASPRSSTDSVTTLLYVIICSVARMEASMNGFEHVHGWFSHNKEWIEFVIATAALWLLMMIAIHELDLRSAG
jgi:hypothetical protein